MSTIEELLERKAAASVQKSEITAVGILHTDYVTPI
jgi:hypothetical protein